MSEPMVVAHRGANISIPEQTLPAYAAAIEVGADAIECDVRLTADGHLVCHHDRTIDRTSDGNGAISELTMAQLREFNFGGKNGDGHYPLLEFADLLELINDAPRRVRMLIETKHPSRFGPRTEHALYTALAKYPKLDVIVMSFARSAVTRYHRLAPHLPLVWLFEYPVGRAPKGTSVIGPKLDLVRARPQLIPEAHARGQRVFVWTVNQTQDAEFVRDSGADAIITDDPQMVLTTLNRAPVGHVE